MVRASAMLRPLLLATLLEDDRGLAGRPALLVSADDRSARDLAADLRAYLAPRRVRLYPSRGTGYASHVTPPPHLVGLRIDALDALRGEDDAVVVASATALAEAVPDASLRPAGFAVSRGEEVDLGTVAADLVAAGYERVDQVDRARPVRRSRRHPRRLSGDRGAGCADRAVRRRGRVDALVLDLHPALARRRRAGRAGAGRRARLRAPRAGRAGGDGGRREGRAALEPGRAAAARALPARRSTWSPARPRSSSPPPRRSSRRCATTGRTRRRRCTPTTPATSTSTSRRRWPSAPLSR